MKLLSEYDKEIFAKLQDPKSENVFPDTNVGFGKNDKEQVDNVVMDVKGQLFVAGRIDEAKTWADGIDTTANTFIIFGLGLGWHVEFLAQKFPKANIYVIEPDKRVLAHAMHIRDMETVFRNCKIWLDMPIINIKGILFEMLTHPLARGIAVVPFYVAVYSEYSALLYAEIQKMLNDWAVMVNTKRTLADKWYGNRIVNAKSPSVNTNGLIGKFGGIPGIIVGAAPSLQSQLEELRALQGKAVIIAASTAAEILKTHGIKPTFMIAIDQDPVTSGALHENMDGDIPLLFDGQVAQNSLKYKGRKFQMLLNVNRYTGMVIPDLPIMESGPSVANVALDVLYKFGCSPILICGMDMSYTNNKLYCDGTQFNKDIEQDGRLMELPGMDGETCLTEPSFLSMKNWYDEYISRVKPPVFNCTVSGLPIVGAEHKKFSDFTFPDIDKDLISKIVDVAYYNPDGTPKYIDVAEINKVNQEIIQQLDEIANQVKVANNITPAMSQSKAWFLLDEFINSMTYIHEIRAEYKIGQGQPSEEVLKEYNQKRADTIIQNINILKEMLK
jgi:hypothetical protein